jgi:hypothetical protein
MTLIINRRKLSQDALAMSLQVRQQLGHGVERPVDIFAIADSLRVAVRLVDISMEGFYARLPEPTILLSALRPRGRRAFNCAHELGHHLFGHGSTVDGLLKEHASAHESLRRSNKTSDEFLVDAFDGFVLMPLLGIRQAYAARSVSVESATPEHHYAVACSFGVGYATLINHLVFSARILTEAAGTALVRRSRPAIRHAIVGEMGLTSDLIVVDRHWRLPTVDAEVGTLVLLPSAVRPTQSFESVAQLPSGHLVRAVRPGIERLATADGFGVFGRVSRRQYTGLARFRHLADDEPDEEQTPLGTAHTHDFAGAFAGTR